LPFNFFIFEFIFSGLFRLGISPYAKEKLTLQHKT